MKVVFNPSLKKEVNSKYFLEQNVEIEFVKSFE